MMAKSEPEKFDIIGELLSNYARAFIDIVILFADLTWDFVVIVVEEVTVELTAQAAPSSAIAPPGGMIMSSGPISGAGCTGGETRARHSRGMAESSSLKVDDTWKGRLRGTTGPTRAKPSARKTSRAGSSR